MQKNTLMVFQKICLVMIFMTTVDQLLSQNCSCDTVINFKTIKYASFKGDCCRQKFARYIEKNLDYPKVSKKDRLTGTVIAQFVVDTNGHPINIKIVQSLGSDYDIAVIEAIKNSPKWIPGKAGDRPINFLYKIPVNFLKKGQKKP